MVRQGTIAGVLALGALAMFVRAGLVVAESAPAAPQLGVVEVHAGAETEPVEVAGDAADDPAIVAGATADDTRVVGTQKKGGIYVYDLKGKIAQAIPGGRPNNVDMRPDFPWADGV